MIYRAIVEQVLNNYKVKVRIPLIHRTSKSNDHTILEDLPDASICTLPNCHPNIKSGDVVIICFENNDISKPLILGYLYKESLSDTSPSLNLMSLTVSGECTLSEFTSIGSVDSRSIQHLYGSKDNIQNQIDQLTSKINNLEEELDRLKKSINT